MSDIDEDKYVMDADGSTRKPASNEEWDAFYRTRKNRRIALDEFDGVVVSTVFLGYDHSFEGPPLLFETMIFGSEYDQEQWRYATKTEAFEGHAKAVNLVKQCQLK